jgi:hypothetical protein
MGGFMFEITTPAGQKVTVAVSNGMFLFSPPFSFMGEEIASIPMQFGDMFNHAYSDIGEIVHKLSAWAESQAENVPPDVMEEVRKEFEVAKDCLRAEQVLLARTDIEKDWAME